MDKIPGIFNDVIGPVMRGPSSSHTAASWRIANTALQLLGGTLKEALIEFDKDGAWASNFREQGTAMGIEGGLLNIEMTDDAMKKAEEIASRKRIKVNYKITSFQTNHPNTVKISMQNDMAEMFVVVAVSLGGGAFRIEKMDNFNVTIKGDAYELIIITENQKLTEKIHELLPSNIEYTPYPGKLKTLYSYKFISPVNKTTLEAIRQLDENIKLYYSSPVMPIIANNKPNLPFTSCPSALYYSHINSKDLGELGLYYEQGLSGLSTNELMNKMKNLIEISERSIELGLTGTDWPDRILQQQSHLIKESVKQKRIISDTLINQIIANVTAVMEAKSAQEVIVANPTAGSCGTVPGMIKAVSDTLKAGADEKIKAYFAAGMIGVFFAGGPGFSAEEHGCQVECGAASGMAAAATVQLYGGTAEQAINAASMAIQNMIGLICDPVADRVEVPCLGKNISAALNGYASAIMALSGFDAVIPFDQVLESVSRVSAKMPACHKCSGTGGLAVSQAAIELKEKLAKRIN